jgi:plastocyanin
MGVAAAGVAISASAPGTSANPIRATTSATAGFTPKTASVRQGGVVNFRNVDRAPHNAVFKRGSRTVWTSGRVTTGNFRLNTATAQSGRRIAKGTYAYICEVHPFMKGTLRVT